MVKLLLRKQETWHRLDTLKYESELGSVSAIVAAIDELCQLGPKPPDVVKKEELEEQEIVDLLMDESVGNLQTEQDKPASVDAEFTELSENRPLALARSEREMDLKNLLECLRLDELKAIAKQLKLKSNQKVGFPLSNRCPTECSLAERRPRQRPPWCIIFTININELCLQGRCHTIQRS
jgi:Fanconi-associated nuclease 1